VRTIYFDYNATTPLDPAVREAMAPFLGANFGNPSSVHHVGRAARAALDDARDRVAAFLGCKPAQIIFTSGGTEASNLAIFGAARRQRPKGRHLITSAVEHHAVLHSFQYLAKHEGFDVTFLPVDDQGVVSPAALEAALRAETTLVSVMAANNETGVIQQVSALGRICQERGTLFHTDAVQWFGKEPFSHIDQFKADFVSICAHKFHGPKGAGALFARSPLAFDPILFGGGHENERRAGTENPATIVGFAEALERFVKVPVFDRAKLAPLAARLGTAALLAPDVNELGSRAKRLSNTVALTIKGCDSIALLAALDLAGICASSGSACSSGSIEPSHVLLAMGLPPERANSLVRFSLGRDSALEEVEAVLAAFPAMVAQIRGSQ